MWDSKQWNKYRQEVILGQMLKEGYITQEEYDEAAAQELVFVGGRPAPIPTRRARRTSTPGMRSRSSPT